jgi:cytochrome c553
MKKLSLAAALLATLAFLTGALRAAEAPANWTKICAPCHGKDGGGTHAGKRLMIKNLMDPEVQKTVTDDQIFKYIKTGEIDSNGKVSMQPMGDRLSDDEIRALVAYVRTLDKS